MTRPTRPNPQRIIQTLALFAVLGLCAHTSPAPADPLPAWQPQHLPVVGVRPGELDVQALRDRLRRAVFRVEAQHIPAPPYRPDPLVYDGALIAVEAPPPKDLPPDAPPPERRILLLSAAAWLAQAQTVTLVAGQDRWPLKIERLDHTLDLALLSAPDGLPPDLEPVTLYDADGLPPPPTRSSAPSTPTNSSPSPTSSAKPPTPTATMFLPTSARPAATPSSTPRRNSSPSNRAVPLENPPRAVVLPSRLPLSKSSCNPPRPSSSASNLPAAAANTLNPAPILLTRAPRLVTPMPQTHARLARELPSPSPPPGASMRTNDDIEAYLIQLNLPFEQIESGMWVIHDEFENIDNIVIYHTPPVIIFRVKLMNLGDVPQDRRFELFEQLLVLNTTDMIHGAYGLEDDNIVCVDSLQSENLDFNEFQASVEALSLAISSHYALLKGFRRDDPTHNDKKASKSEEPTPPPG